ncbi:OmpA family protein [Tsuneonella suprasediminis]|uniref:OmpA family protein n=1 Tax=Tsuneonella suprasediminis TaxID=2306996 RepID=A0A419R424_9SPHN|nr:OmpA family protein [Tsuneonella suprasediminis]RJX69166.1 OmpA family protein [Tsuneonella suprasediminis]
MIDLIKAAKAMAICSGTALILSACHRGGSSDEATDTASSATDVAPTPSDAASEGGEKISIFRPDVEIAREPKPMAPLSMRIGFDDGGSELSDAARKVLQEVLNSPQMKAGGAIVLGGHTDSAGNDAANLRASRKRAETVRDWLIEHGVAEKRITVIAFGEQNPVAPNAKDDGTPDEDARARNRRVDITIAVPPGTPEAAKSGAAETLVDELTTTR